MIALIDVEAMAHEINYGEGGHYGDDPEDSFRAALKKTALYYFESGTAPDATLEKLAVANAELAKFSAFIDQLQKEKQQLEQSVLKLQNRPSDLPKVQAERVKHARYECESCHKKLRIQYTPGVLVSEEQRDPGDIATAGDCPACGGAVVPAPKEATPE